MFAARTESVWRKEHGTTGCLMEVGNCQKLTYEFKLFRLRPGEDPQVSARREPEGLPNGPSEPPKEALKRRIAGELVGGNFKLRVSEFPYGQIARFEQISEDTARRKYRHVELNGPEGGSGLQVVLRDDEAWVTVPLWHEGERAREVFREVWRCLELIRRGTNYLCYDPQLGKLIELSTSEAQVLGCYETLVQQSRQAVPPSNGNSQAKVEPIPARIRQLIVCDEREVVLVAVRESGALFGFADVCIEQTPANGAPSTRVASLKGWYVTPEFRGRGIGRQLRDSAKEWAAGLGVNGWT